MDYFVLWLINKKRCHFLFSLEGQNFANEFVPNFMSTINKPVLIMMIPPQQNGTTHLPVFQRDLLSPG
jgi:hypothetical protein